MLARPRRSRALDGVAEEMLAAVVVASGVEFEQPVADVIRLRCLLRGLGVRRLEVDADAGEDASELLHVFLGVA